MEPACDSAAPSSESLREARRFVEGNGALARALGVDGPGELTVLPLAQGEHNANFVLGARGGRRFVLRVNYASQLGLTDQVGYEFAALRALAPSGRAPEPLYVDGTRSRIGRGALVESFVEGAWIDLEDSRQVREAARALADVHSVAAPPDCALLRAEDPLRSQLESCRRLFDGYQASDLAEGRVMREVDELFVRAQRAVDAAPVPSSCECSHILNTEAVPSHFLIDDTGRASIVDWEKPVLGEVAQDLAYFLSPTTTIWDSDVIIFSAPERAQFLKGLLGGRRPLLPGVPSTPAFRPTHGQCAGGRHLSCNAWVEYHDPARPLRNEKIPRFLPTYFSEEFLASSDCFDAQ